MIVGAMGFRNEFDGHTLEPALEQTKRLVGKAPKKAAVDRGYRGRKQIGETQIQLPKPFNNKTQTKYQQKKLKEAHKKRAAIEPVIGHLLSQSYKGAIITHIITQELISVQSKKSELPHFWVREKKQASSEVDLVYAIDEKVIPIEIKSGSTGSLKSLHQFIERTNHPYAVRIYAGEFEIQETKTPGGVPYLLMNLPYCLGTLISEYLAYFIKNYKL